MGQSYISSTYCVLVWPAKLKPIATARSVSLPSRCAITTLHTSDSRLMGLMGKFDVALHILHIGRCIYAVHHGHERRFSQLIPKALSHFQRRRRNTYSSNLTGSVMPNELPVTSNGIGKLETQEASRCSWLETRSVQMIRITYPPREGPPQYAEGCRHPHEVPTLRTHRPNPNGTCCQTRYLCAIRVHI